MATQYSNKPIVTNGLVYALDFGNQKSYVSGSSSARSLKFDSITGSILTFGGASIPNLQNGLLKMVAPTSATGSTIDTLQQFSDLIPSGDFTVQLVATFPVGNIFITQGPAATRLISDGNGMFGWYINPIPYGGGSFYKTITKNIPTGLKHITYRYSSGSYDMFVNGVPMPTTARGSTTSTNTSTLTINGYGSIGLGLGTQDIGNFYIYNRALTSDEIYSNYLIQAQRYGLPTIAKPYTIDENAFLFLSQSGITDPIITSSINTFVLGLKSASLWDKMIAIYPFVGTGSVGVNLTGSQSWNLKDPTTAYYKLAFTGSWNGSVSGSTPSGSGTAINTGVLPYEYYPFKSDSNQHLSILSYDTPVSSSILAGTGMTKELAVSTLAGDYGTPAAAYSVRKVRTAYSGALMDVRRSIDNVTSSIGYVSNGDLDTGSLLNFVRTEGNSYLPGAYSGLAAAYSLRKVSSSYSGFAIDVRRDSDNTTSSIGFNATGGLDTGTLLAFVTGSANTGSGFVAQWYDQSGNARHATQTATGSQPLIVSSGSLITENGKPALRFIIDNSSSLNLPGSPLSGSNAFGIYAVANFSSSNSYEMLYAEGLTTPNVEIRRDSTSNNLQWITGDGTFPAGTASIDNRQILISINRNALVSNTAFVNGTLDATLTTSSNAITSTTASIGKRSDGYYFDGNIQEITFFTGSAASSSRALIENNINTYYNVYTSSNAGYVARWYDQSGNNRHATQTTTGSQPLIVLSGSVLTEPTSSKPALRFDGVNDNLSNSTNLSLPQPNTIIAVAQRGDLIEQRVILDTFLDINRNVLQSFDGKYGMFAGGGLAESVGTLNTNQNSYFSLFNGASSNLYVNNILKLDGNAGSQTLGSINIGAFRGTLALWSGSIQEVTIYNSNQSPNREAISYGINNYYNIYSQPTNTSWTTSSFTIYATTSSISASINNELQSGIASSGPLGFITVSRTGSNSLTLARNGVTSSFAVPASGALSTNLYLGAINNNGLALGSSPYNISFASVGVGLTGNDLIQYNGLVSELQGNLNTDTDATTFIQAAGLTGSFADSTKIPSAITFLTQNLKRYGLWTKMRAIYPFVGNSSQSQRINLKNPSLYPLNYGSGYTFSTQNGSVPGATITGFDMGVNANAILSPNSGSFGFYTPTNVTRNGWTFGNTQFSLVIALYGVSSVYLNYSDTVATTAYGRGFYAMSKTGSFVEGFYNSGRIYSGSQSTGSISGNMTFGSGQGTTSDAAFTFAYVSDSLTTSDVQNLYSVVQSYQTILGRQV